MVLVEEVDGPGDVPWQLLTNLLIDSVEDIPRVIDDYAARWTIEVLF